MKVYFVIIISLILFFCYSCAPGVLLTTDDIQKNSIRENTSYIIINEIDLQGRTVLLPPNCTLCFTKKGSLKNGTVIGQNTKLRYNKPFIGESLTVTGCTIIGKKLIRDTDVFIRVAHVQNEIQTLFDFSGDIKLQFSPGTYENIERIEINSNVDADFKNGIIHLAFDKYHVGECFYMEPWVDKHVNYVKIRNLKIEGERSGIQSLTSRRCIQLFFVKSVEFDNVTIDKYDGGPSECKNDDSDLLDKSRIGSCVVAIIKYDHCVINHCNTNDINKEIFWCVPNVNPNNLTIFTNNTSTCSKGKGSASFLTLLDGRCIVKNNKVYDYIGSGFNLFCYDSEVSGNFFYGGKRSVAIDLSENTMYRSKNVNVHNNECLNCKGFISAYGENIQIVNNVWTNDTQQTGKRFAVIYIKTREEREPEGHYIGSDNNPSQDEGSRRIQIENNTLTNSYESNEIEIRGAQLYGDNIIVNQNIMKGLNMPVVQFVEGNNFQYVGNVSVQSKMGRYAEVLVNKVGGIELVNNTFSQLYTDRRKISCVVQVKKVEGKLVYRNNIIDKQLSEFDTLTIFVPCLIDDESDLTEAEIFVDKKMENRFQTGVSSKRVLLRTNIRNKE